MRHGFALRQTHTRTARTARRCSPTWRRADPPRADHHHAAQGEGAPRRRRQAGHARQEGRPRTRRLAAAQLKEDDVVVKLFDHARRPLQGPQGRLHPRPQGRLPLWRQRPAGRDRTGRPRRRRQGRRRPRPRRGDGRGARGLICAAQAKAALTGGLSSRAGSLPAPRLVCAGIST